MSDSSERDLRAAATLPLDAFLERVRTPHLAVITAPEDATAALSVGTLQLSSSSRSRWSRASLVAVAKRPGSNPFMLMVTLGRAANNDVVLASSGVSKFHAYLQALGEGWVITDAGSLNGTWVDGARLSPDERRRLRDGAGLRLGDGVVMTFLEPAGLHRYLRSERPPGLVRGAR